MKSTNIQGPFLIIAPLSLVDQWQSEINTWSPKMNVVLLHGNQQAREIIISREFYYQDPYITKSEATTLKRSNVYKFNILLTTYENAVKEVGILGRIQWQVCLLLSFFLFIMTFSFFRY
jgi:SNF2 family DNA or RNA helicase